MAGLIDPPEDSSPNRIFAWSMYDSTLSLRLALGIGSLSRWASILSGIVSAAAGTICDEAGGTGAGGWGGGRGGEKDGGRGGASFLESIALTAISIRVSAPTVLTPVVVSLLLCGDERGDRGGKYCESRGGGAEGGNGPVPACARRRPPDSGARGGLGGGSGHGGTNTPSRARHLSSLVSFDMWQNVPVPLLAMMHGLVVGI